MEHDQKRPIVRIAATRLHGLSVVAIVFALVCIPAAARAVQPLITHHAVSQVPSTPKACLTERASVHAPAVVTVTFAAVDPVLQSTGRIHPFEEVVPVVPRVREAIGLRAPPR